MEEALPDFFGLVQLGPKGPPQGQEATGGYKGAMFA